MIAKGKTLDEIRDSHHPFGQALQELRGTCDLVCSAPMAAILAGEHAGVDGALMLVTPLPLRVYVGTIGRNSVKPQSLPPILSSFRYYDARTDEVQDRSHNPEYLGAEENIRNIATLLTEIALRHRLKFLPAEMVVLSEAVPGRGSNWSGAFSAAVALALYLLQGKKIPEQLYPQSWKNTSQIPERDLGIEKLFRIALKIECVSHSLASGYGPACSLLPALGKLFIYKGFIDQQFANARGDPRRISGFFICHWDVYQQRLRSAHTYQLSDLYDLLLIDSGQSKSTTASVARVRGTEEANLVQDIVNMLNEDPNLPSEIREKSQSLTDELFESRRIGISTLAMLSVLTVKTLRDCCAGIDNPRAIPRVISSIDTTHQRLGLSFPELDRIREHFEKELLHRQLGIKLTGGGGGGNIVIWGLTKPIQAISTQELASHNPQPTLIWQLSQNGLATQGASCDHPQPFHPFYERAGKHPTERPPEPHQAIVLDASGETNLLPSQPEPLFQVYRALRTIALKGTCLYLYYYNDSAKDKFEPLYLTWPVRDEIGEVSLRSMPSHADEGFVLLKELLVAFAKQGQISLDVSTTAFWSDGTVRYDASILAKTRAALNTDANKCSREAGFEFPHLSKKSPVRHAQRTSVSLILPQNSYLCLIYPFSQSNHLLKNNSFLLPPL